ncbi:MAG TPA: histidine kinase [Ferruginibacter sp.]|nr:histidine kinase [Ferruginibacter sp.]HRE62573.1 histidine kinase [Ferruginibacter sp.]
MCFPVAAQQKSRYNFFRYSVNEGLLQSTVLDLAIDKNNFCWLSYTNGIQRFDGVTFELIPIQSGLPDNMNVEFFKQQNGNLLFIHGKGISRYNVDKNSFEQVFTLAEGSSEKLKLIGEDNGVIYIYEFSANIIALNATTYQKLYTTALPFLLPISGPSMPQFSSIEKDTLNMVYRYQLFQYKLSTKRLLKTSPPLPGLLFAFMKNEGANNLYCFKQDKIWQLCKYNFSDSSLKIIYQSSFYTPNFKGLMFHWNNKNLMFYYDRFLEMSKDWNNEIAEILDFKNNRITANVSVKKIVEDNFGNLYFLTVNDGIRKLTKNSYALRYYGIPENKQSYTLCIYPDVANNKILLGTFGNGLYIFDSLQNLVKHIKYLPGENAPFSVNSITKNNLSEYIFLSVGKSQAYKLSANLQHIVPVSIHYDSSTTLPIVHYFSKLIYEGTDNAILQTERRFFMIDKNSNQIKSKLIYNAATHGGILHKGKIIVHSNDEIREYDTTNFNLLRQVSFPGTAGVRSYAAYGNQLYFGSNKGLFVTDEHYRVIKKYNRQTGLPDECIYAIEIDKNKNVWTSTNKGIVRISASGQLFQLTKEDGLQENEFNTNTSFQTKEGEIYFGGINGVNSFFPSAIPTYTSGASVIITDIKVNNSIYTANTAFQNLQKIELPYDQNSLEISFIASGALNADRYVHQYKMDGYDKKWFQLTPGDPVRYMLPPGKYIFKTYAAAYFNNDAIPLHEMQIIIHPPFWKTWWFLSLLTILALGSIIYIINRYNKARYQKRVNLLQMQQKVQEERGRISMELHDSIGAYANAVLHNTDLLQVEKNVDEKNQIMKDLRFASKDIITALRETIWALKKENYAASDCLLRIRNFMQSFGRYYHTIEFKVEGTAPSEKELHYGQALNVVRIVQESVNNAIKHGGPSTILIKSSEINNNGWQLDIIDNGVGFDNNQIKPGNGLVNMNKRAEEWNFKIIIHSELKKGTSISIYVP